MFSQTPVEVITIHAEGEVGHVVVGGVDPPPGDTLWDQRDWLHRDGRLRNYLLNEPRGGVFCHFNLIVPAKQPEAAFGFLIMEPEHTPPMSGSNAICVATALINSGRIPITGPQMRFKLEAPAGLIDIVADCDATRARAITLTNVPSFADQLGVALELPGHGTLSVDTGFGGDSYVLVDAPALGLSLTPDEAGDLRQLGTEITKAANEQIGFSHLLSDWNHISFCQFTTPVEPLEDGLTGRSAVVIDPGKIDRSPCGTGCSARMAILAARGQLRPGQSYVGTSLIGSRFDCRYVSETQIGDRPAIIPSIRGRAFVIGRTEFLLDPADPFPAGYRLSDTWPM